MPKMQVSSENALLNGQGVIEKSPNRGVLFVKSFWNLSESRLLLAIFLGGVILAYQTSAFLNPNNLRSVLLAFSFSAIAALGQVIVIITGRIDLSVGSTIGLTGMLTAMMLVAGVNMFLAILLGVLFGAFIGAINGFFITKFKINSFIVTLGTLQIARGVTVGLTEGDTVTGFPTLFLSIGSSTFAGLPIPVWIAIILTIIFTLLLKYTRLGREFYAMGGNETASWLAGVQVKKLEMLAFVLSGAMAGIAGVLLTSRLGAAVSNAGFGYELTVIAAVVIGGASLSGGVGTALGVVLGALLIGMVNNALVLLFVPTYWQQTFTGGVIVIAALIDRMRNSS